MTVNSEQFPRIEEGTNCLTQAEDRVATYLRDSEAFWAFCGAADADAAAEHIYIDSPNGPEGYAFSLDEIQERGSMALVLVDSNEGISFEDDGSGGTIESTTVLVFLERFTPYDSDRQQMQQQRIMKNLAQPVARELFDDIRGRHGTRYLSRMHMEIPGPLVEWEEEEMLGMRTGALLVLEFGPGDSGG